MIAFAAAVNVAAAEALILPRHLTHHRSFALSFRLPLLQ
jgi:hypothetical protein